MKMGLYVLTFVAFVSLSTVTNADQNRYFQFTYRATVTDIPTDSKLVQLWIPYPTSNNYQIIDDMRIDSPYPIRITREPEYGNNILYVEVVEPLLSSFTVELQFTALRREQMSDQEVMPELPAGLQQRLLQPDRLVPIDGEIAELSATTTSRYDANGDKTRAIYDYVTRTMLYDKSGVGWGYGDALYACDVGAGNCTDFHSLIIGMARAADIPGIFEIGFPLPADQTQGEVSGYHCWAELHVDGQGWIPVDSSEASKHPEKFDYFYGNLDANRVEFSRGRDIVLCPAQSGAPLNYFIYPYAEVDGEVHHGLEKRFLFEDLPIPSWAQ